MDFYDGGKIFYCNPNKPNSSTKLTYTVHQDTNKVKYNFCKFKNASPHFKTDQHFLGKKIISMETIAGSSRGAVLPLRKLCVSYIVYHLHLVDSLQGLPEIIGEELFNSCADARYFQVDHTNNWQKALQIFISAYENKVLRTLHVSGSWMFVSLCWENITPYVHLEELDISRCKIGNEHGILKHVGSLNFLKKLCLQNNNLSKEGIKNLTLTYRRAKKGLESLEVLRLDGNPSISLDAFSYLDILPRLNVIIVDRNLSIINGFKLQTSLSKLGICPHSIRYHADVFICNERIDMIGDGWATTLIKSQIDEVNLKLEKSQARSCDEKKKKVFSFYKKKLVPVSIEAKTNCATLKPLLNQLVVCGCLSKTPQNRSAALTARHLAQKRQGNMQHMPPNKLQCTDKNRVIKNSATKHQSSNNSFLLNLYLPA